MAQLDGSKRYMGSPKTSVPATVEQLLQAAGDPSSLQTGTSPSFRRDYEQEDDHATPSKKSVLAKVKEKAKKWKQTLVKKKPANDDNTTPSWGVTLDDEDGEEVDPEYLGAPMYESELAPEGYKETARQHPRAIPVIPESHVLANNVSRQEDDDDKEKETSASAPTSPTTTKTIADTVTETLAPAYATVAEATQNIASKIQGLTISAPIAPAAGGAANSNGSSEQIWDKGVSVKEYIMNKLEPGEDERALSQVISEAISPRKTPGEMGVVEKVREAVTMLLRNEESSPATTPTTTKPSSTSPTSTKPSSSVSPISINSASQTPRVAKLASSIPISAKSPSQPPAATNSASQALPSSKPASQIPISTNVEEVNIEENHGRILQTN